MGCRSMLTTQGISVKSLLLVAIVAMANCSFAAGTVATDPLSVNVVSTQNGFLVTITNRSTVSQCVQEPDLAVNLRVFAFAAGSPRESTTTAGRPDGKPTAVLLAPDEALEFEVEKQLLVILADAEPGDEIGFEYEASRRPTLGPCVPLSGSYPSNQVPFE